MWISFYLHCTDIYRPGMWVSMSSKNLIRGSIKESQYRQELSTESYAMCHLKEFYTTPLRSYLENR